MKTRHPTATPTLESHWTYDRNLPHRVWTSYIYETDDEEDHDPWPTEAEQDESQR